MNIYFVADIVTKSLYCSLAISAIVSIILTVYFQLKNIRILVYLLISLLFGICDIYLGQFQNLNHFLIPVFGMVEYFVWTRFFTPGNLKLRKRLIVTDILLVVYTCFEFYYLLVNSSFMIIPSRSVAYLLVILVMIYNYLKTMQIPSGINWMIYSFVFLYASFNCTYFLLLNFSIYWKDEHTFFLWFFHSFLLHFFYLFLPYYQWKTGRSPQHFLFG